MSVHWGGAGPVSRWPKASSGPTIYPLDLAGDLPMFAYSTKKLREAYSGSAFRVVRPSDSATLDVGFVGQNLDTDALDTFLGSELGQLDFWHDQTGNGNNALQTTAAERPVIESGSISGGPIMLGGARAIIFDTDNMDLPVGVSASRQACNVFSINENFVATGTQSALFQIGSSTDQMSVFMPANTSTGRTLTQNPGGSSSWRVQSRSLIYENRLGAAASSISQGSETHALGAQSAVTMTGGFIGNTALAGGYDGKYYAAAYIGYARDLASDERTALRDAMNTLFSITESSTSRVIYVGDSITAASSSAQSPRQYGYAKMADRLLPAHHAYNISGGGNRIEVQLPIYSTTAGVIVNAYSDNRILFLALGTNDLTSGRTDTQIYDDIQSYCALAKADGALVIVTTILPATGHDATMDTYRASINTSLRNNWASFADGLCDLAANATMGASGAENNATLYPDGLHPSRLGHTYLAVDVVAAIEALL